MAVRRVLRQFCAFLKQNFSKRDEFNNWSLRLYNEKHNQEFYEFNFQGTNLKVIIYVLLQLNAVLDCCVLYINLNVQRFYDQLHSYFCFFGYQPDVTNQVDQQSYGTEKNILACILTDLAFLGYSNDLGQICSHSQRP